MALVQIELLLFAAVFFAIGLVDELAIDIAYAWCRLTGRARTHRVPEEALPDNMLSGMAAVFIPAWREDAVIGSTIVHALAAWPQDDLRIYVGCYRNDAETIASVVAAARGDERVRLVVVGEDGPTCKAHCLNRLHEALAQDEVRSGRKAHMVVLHDAEDMVDPAALTILDHAIWNADFVQLPVMALPPSDSRWIASHYSDEFAEAHAKHMVVRDALGCAIPGAGVGCAISRQMLAKLAVEAGGQPFAQGALTEDYELGMRVSAAGGSSRFLRLRTEDGRLIATRAYFPDELVTAVRQKTRWTHGIALQGWDRLGWEGNALQRWMTFRDRRGPLVALLLFIGYALLVSGVVAAFASQAGLMQPVDLSPGLEGLLILTFAGLVWRTGLRAVFTGREYGLAEGFRAIPRVIVSNVISIMSGRRALAGYIRTLRGAPVVWDKTEHSAHPAQIFTEEKTA
ncbi:glycosyl transferase family protein [Qipengyuania xiamenensis]|uniref:glycosyl transferase family protein n=1 Tax=Qipengyuania xiamenensis TaxID=2867237 RepID=UPI001FFC5115|nr:glycosyl transferase family protein [Qipengyuania xiamenensis]